MKSSFVTFASVALLSAVTASAQIFPISPPTPGNVGSWFGRAVVNNPWCTPGGLVDPDNPDFGPCPIPPEIVMLPTFFEDGNFIAIDSNVFLGDHTTAHGQWEPTAPGAFQANWVFLQSTAEGAFAGAFRMRMEAHNTSEDTIDGSINAFFMPFTDENSLVITDENGIPVPDPLGDLPPYINSGADCAPPLNGCFGVFTFTIRRVKVPD